MRSKSLVGLVVAALVFTFTFALAAGAEETTDASAAATKDEGSEQPLRFAEGERTSQADARAVTRVSGPLAGTRVGTLTTDGDAFIDLITIPRPDCTAGEGASFVLQDEDGTQADFIEGTNVQIDEGDPGLRVVGLGVQNANISPLNIRGGDGILDSGGLVIVTSTDIECTDDNPPPPDNPPPDNPPPDNPPPDNSPPPSASPQPEPQDRDKGPLAGGVAVGKDVLVPGDVVDVLPDGTRVVGIDQIVIKTENCKLTAQGDDLTITMSDQGVPFRIRDGQNADISIEPDGTIVANGRRTLGDDFPPGMRDNPDRLIVPIPVDPENDQFAREPNSRFPIISSTGIEGQDCHVVENADTGNAADNGSMDNGSMDNGGDTSSKNDVIPDTTSKKPLPETGGVPLYGAIVFGLVLASAGVLLFSISAFQPVSTSARRRSTRYRQPPTG